MRHSLSLKFLFRTPLKTTITFLLIAAASFALFSRVTDYVIISREMDNAASHYRGIAALDNGVPLTKNFFNASYMPATIEAYPKYQFWCGSEFEFPTALTVEQIEAFSSLPGAHTETRYMTAGLIRDYRRIDDSYSPFYDWGFDYSARFALEGTFTG